MAKECAFIAIIESDFGYEFESELELDLKGEERGEGVQGTVALLPALASNNHIKY